MNYKKLRLAALTVSGAALLAACGGKPADKSSTPVTPASSQTSSAPVDEHPFKMTVAKASFASGLCFMDGARPTVMAYYQNEYQDLAEYFNMIQYTIVDKADASKTYGAGETLPAGEYTATAIWNSRGARSSLDFTVTGTAPEVATEGKGYHTVKAEDLESYRVYHYQKLGALGGQKFPSMDADFDGDGTIDHPKLLVIPVQFSNAGATFAGQGASDEQVAEILNEAFFAPEYTDEAKTTRGTPWLSLSAYYEKASYGKLHIEGTVTPIYTYPFDESTFSSSDTGLSGRVMAAAVTWLKNDKGFDMTEYDADKDGFIDGIEIIYCTTHTPASQSGDSQTSGSDAFWNYTTNAGGAGNVSSPVGARYFWSRFDYVRNSYFGTDTVDAHTIIHENGHMMGLNDYYDYGDSTTNTKTGPAGCVDMMDMNVGDHNAYSKMIYGWVVPRVIDGTSSNFEVTINSYTDTGDFILLKNTVKDANGNPKSDWNGMPWDEYFLIEYYTPTGVNEADSHGYGEWTQASSTGSNAYGHGGTYEQPGIQVFHVDARLATKISNESSGNKRTSTYTDNLIDATTLWDDASNNYGGWGEKTKEDASSMLHDNTPSRSVEPNGDKSSYVELHAIFGSGSNGLDSSSYYSTFGNTANLFGDQEFEATKSDGTKGEKKAYGGSCFTNYKMNSFMPNGLTMDDGSTLNWNWTVTAQTDTTATLHFVQTDA